MRRTVLFGASLLVAAAAVGLGLWQLRRLGARREANRIAAAARAMPPLALAGADSVRLGLNRRARLVGLFDERHEFLLRGRVVQGVPAVLVVTPLRTAGRDTAMLVNRGYVPAPDATDPGAATWSEPGTIEVEGVLLPVPDRGDGAPLLRDGRETWRALDLAAMRNRLPYPIAPLYLVAESTDSASLAHTVRGRVYPFRAQVPGLDDGPHLMYAVQWFGIGVAVLAFGWLFILRRPAWRKVE